MNKIYKYIVFNFLYRCKHEDSSQYYYVNRINRTLKIIKKCPHTVCSPYKTVSWKKGFKCNKCWLKI